MRSAGVSLQAAALVATLEGNGEPVEYFLMRHITKIVSNLAEGSNASSPDSGELARSPQWGTDPDCQMTHARLPVEL